MRNLVLAALLCLFTPVTIVAEENPYTNHARGLYKGIEKLVLRSAEQMPEEQYAFKPVESVRTFGQILGHIADAQYLFCSKVRVETNPAPKVEKTKTSKADLIASLNDAFAYCKVAYDGMTDAKGTELIKLMGGESPKLGALNVNNVHTTEHYGNLVTYMRMKDLVPPTSDPEFMKKIRD